MFVVNTTPLSAVSTNEAVHILSVSSTVTDVVFPASV
jgi:hypothetical protein